MEKQPDFLAKIIVSEGAEGGQPGVPPTLIGPALTLNMPVVPTALSFNVSVLIHGASFSKPQQLKLVIALAASPMDKVFELAGNLPPFDTPKGTMVFNFGVHNAVFRSAGMYRATVFIDGKEITTDTFVTIAMEEQDANSADDTHE